MYISILEQQAKYDDALEILSGNLGSLIGIEADKLRLQVVLAFIASFSYDGFSFSFIILVPS